MEEFTPGGGNVYSGMQSGSCPLTSLLGEVMSVFSGRDSMKLATIIIM